MTKPPARFRSRQWLKRLAKVESPDVTYLSETFPIVMARARGMTVQDVDKNKYLDFTSCFGVMALGHGNAKLKTALVRQSSRLIHGMGDVHPSVPKIQLLETLGRLSPYENPQAVLSLSGGEAVETAMKTAMLATNRHRFLSFEGGYHGLQLGPLALNGRETFTSGFEGWLGQNRCILPFPVDLEDLIPRLASKQDPWTEERLACEHGLICQKKILEQLETQLKTRQFAAVVFEPIQGRGGDREWPRGFWEKAAALAKASGTLLIADEIYTGFGRTGRMFGHEWIGIQPDLLCVGKAMGGGLPLSACVGESALFSHWGKSKGEARHTSTFLGHPLACAVGTAALNEISSLLTQKKQDLNSIKPFLEGFVQKSKSIPNCMVRGQGAMLGLWFFDSPPGWAVQLAEHLLVEGFLVLPSGPRGDVLSLAAPLIATPLHYKKFMQSLEKICSLQDKT